jgi:hypothetical protein
VVDQAFQANKRLAQHLWGKLPTSILSALRHLTSNYGFSVECGDLICLERHWYITHSGLLRLASRRRCVGINVDMVPAFCDPADARWTFKATVFPWVDSEGFVGYGDADPSNVSPLVRGAEMRMAETRAVNRALRKAYGVGTCSIEEVGSLRGSEPTTEARKIPPQSSIENGVPNGNGGPRVRDRLCQLIRQHQLDPNLVKAYAVDFCGSKTLKEATRAQVESFVDHLADWGAKDRDALLCQLNSYPLPADKDDEKAGAA